MGLHEVEDDVSVVPENVWMVSDGLDGMLRDSEIRGLVVFV